MTRPVLPTVAWGLFCACSWTWCIGMFLPKLMVERYGLAGFALFAVPNVLGCAAFGYVLADRGRALVERHGGAMVTFSLVAIAFQLFFVAFVFDAFVLDPDAPAWLPLLPPLVILVVARLLADAGDRTWLVFAGLVYAFSIFAFWNIGTGAAPRLREPGTAPAGDLLWLGPVFVVGFALCPYLDLTFHRALRCAPSRNAFAVFGLAFAVMIVLTCFLWFAPATRLFGVALGHVVGQVTFTVGAHIREVRASPVIAGHPRRRWLVLLPLLAIPVPLVAGVLLADPDVGTGLYLRFMVFYGLVFPAYVLVFIGPWRPLAPTPRALGLLAIALVGLAPFYEAAFIHGRAPLLAVPAVALVAWVIARTATRPAA